MKVNWPTPVSLPSTDEVVRQLAYCLRPSRQPREPESVYRALADHFALDARQRHVGRRTRSEPAWHNRVQTARKVLVAKGLMNDGPRGLWSLTDAGRAAADRWKNAEFGIPVDEGL